MVGRTFIKNFPRSKRLLEAKKMLAQAHQGNRNFVGALKMFQELLSLSKNKAEIHYLIAKIKTETKKYLKSVYFLLAIIAVLGCILVLFL